MIREYAVQPQMLMDRRMCRLLADSFGISRGRLISRFPDFWDELVQWALAEARPAQKMQIVEALARLRQKMMTREFEWNGGGLDEWLEEAEREDVRRPFSAILATANPRRNPRVLEEDALTDANALWNVETTCSIQRTADAIANCGAMLLRSAKEVIFVDPYFQPNEPRYLRPLEKLFERCLRDPAGDRLLRVEFHTSTNSGAPDHIRRACDGRLADILPVGMPFRIIRWEAEVEFHNRYILSNRGGLSYGHGLDDGAGRDDVSILSESHHLERWREFQRPSPARRFADEFLVVGRKR